ncbi:MAG TPA: hypothetical protein PLL30_10150 [Candidatus Krumholzibacteria bacterium]|nr:hypothetical protein [Candidatus Krumholzibacteria bacterium]HPD72122.1 hypothetical protein [Candidatus Krumholzibacteria bacterium]HRY40946.1 hypothetical protein [Candidatus Krumholzibacteria bacterium]
MQRLRTFVILLLCLAAGGLGSYELVQKSAQTPLGPLPGSDLATRADRSVHWRATTGIAPLDLVLHESQEACLYYRQLATGRIRSAAPASAPVQ